MKQKMRDIHFRIPTDLAKQVERLADAEADSLNHMLIILVKEALEQRAKAGFGGVNVVPHS